jgi:hypothetical protein
LPSRSAWLPISGPQFCVGEWFHRQDGLIRGPRLEPRLQAFKNRKSIERIDGIVELIMALDRATMQAPE